MVNFLLLIEEITPYNKKIIDRGLTPQKIYILCSCIRETFCLSYSIRKQNNLFLYFQKEHILVSLIGNELRYLGPDERSQALLLEKALDKAMQTNFIENDRRILSTPGISVLRFLDHDSFLRYIHSLIPGTFFFNTEDEGFIKNERDRYISHILPEFFIDRNLLIIPIYNNLNGNLEILNIFNDMKNIKFFSLSKIREIENKILYLNYQNEYQHS